MNRLGSTGVGAMGFSKAVRTCFAKYGSSKGRASRSEYWYFFLFVFLVNIGAEIVDFALGTNFAAFGKGPVWGDGLISIIVYFALVVPQITVLIRRLHDTNHSGALAVWAVVAAIIMGIAIAGASSSQNPDWDGFARLSAVVVIVLIIAILIRLIAKGTVGENKYGPDPLLSVVSNSPNKLPKDRTSVADEISKLKNLLESGAITPEEYNKLKADLLGA